MTSHPAKFSAPIMHKLADLVDPDWLVLDPFAGTGMVHDLPCSTVGVEIEPEWANMHPNTIVGDALHLPFPDGTFDAIVTSPTYGNRMADHHEAKEICKKCDGSGRVYEGLGFTSPPFRCDKCDGKGTRLYTRMTYRHQLGRPLHPNNSGQMQWGSRYQRFHEKAWAEAARVLGPDGKFILNSSDHIRDGKPQPVTWWHLMALKALGFKPVDSFRIPTSRMGFGANREKRLEHEHVIVLVKRESSVVATKRIDGEIPSGEPRAS